MVNSNRSQFLNSEFCLTRIPIIHNRTSCLQSIWQTFVSELVHLLSESLWHECCNKNALKQRPKNLTHPVSSMMQPNHGSGHLQSPIIHTDTHTYSFKKTVPLFCYILSGVEVWLPAVARSLFHIIPRFCPKLWHKVIAIGPTFPYWHKHTNGMLALI